MGTAFSGGGRVCDRLSTAMIAAACSCFSDDERAQAERRFGCPRFAIFRSRQDGVFALCGCEAEQGRSSEAEGSACLADIHALTT